MKGSELGAIAFEDGQLYGVAYLGYGEIGDLSFYFKDYPTDLEKVAQSFMAILEGGISRESGAAGALPIRIEVEFDDDLEEDEEPGERETAE